MDPTTWTAIAVVASLVTGGVAGYAIAPNGAARALEQQKEAIAELNAGNQALIEQVNAVALIEAEKDAEIADRLTGIPPMCVPELGGSVDTAGCMLAWCMRTGETTSQRCEPAKLMDLYITQIKARDVSCPD